MRIKGKTVCMTPPDCIHSFVLSDELDELLDSQTEFKTTLQREQMSFHSVSPTEFLFCPHEAWTE